jgi:hypothetical protein
MSLVQIFGDDLPILYLPRNYPSSSRRSTSEFDRESSHLDFRNGVLSLSAR